MNTDFRVAVDFFSHHKARKLKKRLSSEGLLSLLQLWAYAAKLRTDGELSGMDAEDIEIAAGWDGEDGVFVAALVEVGFLDQHGEAYALHDWVENNSWAADAVDRQDKARFSRLATVNRTAFDKLKAKGVNAISKEDYERLTNVRRPSDERQTNADEPPTPAPSPAPTHKDKEGGDNAGARDVAPMPGTPPEQFQGDPDGLNPADSGSAVLVQPFSEPAATVSSMPKRTDCPSKGNPQWQCFMSCWQVYPVKQGQEAAWCEWMRLHANGTLAESYAIRDAIILLAQEDSRWQRGKVPNMAKWLSGKGWNDSPYVEPAAAQGITPRDGPPVARTQAQRNRQNLEGIAAFVRAADREIGNGNRTAHIGGIGAHGHSLPAAN